MSAKRVASAIARLREATAEAAWAQWSAIFTVAASRRPARAIVDPEALLLISLLLRDHEPRLWSAVVLWAQVGARLLSVQRAKITTLGERVEDTFLISGAPLQVNKRQIEIETELLETLEGVGSH